MLKFPAGICAMIMPSDSREVVSTGTEVGSDNIVGVLVAGETIAVAVDTGTVTTVSAGVAERQLVSVVSNRMYAIPEIIVRYIVMKVSHI
jgi:hypothetical protein